MWTYQEARRAVFGQLLEGLANVDRVAEGELLADVRLNVQKMSNVADPALLTSAAKDPESVRAGSRELQRYNHRLLQISLYDGDGKAVVVSTPKGNPEPPNRVGAAYAVDGRPFVSDPYVSTAFNRRVLYISVPILAPEAATRSAGWGCGTTCRTRSARCSSPPGSATPATRSCSTTTARCSPTMTRSASARTWPATGRSPKPRPAAAAG